MKLNLNDWHRLGIIASVVFRLVNVVHNALQPLEAPRTESVRWRITIQRSCWSDVATCSDRRSSIAPASPAPVQYASATETQAATAFRAYRRRT